jgi:hypothetical protein
LLLFCSALLKHLSVLLCLERNVSNAVIAAVLMQQLVVARCCSMRHVRKQLAIFYDDE